VQQHGRSHRALRGPQVEVGHAPADQRVALAEVVADVEAGKHRRHVAAGLGQGQQLDHGVPERLVAFVGGAEHDLRRLPPEVDGVLHAEVEALAALRGVHVSGIDGEQDPAAA
jgi:hypothetical protein